MAIMKKVTIREVFMGKLEYGADLLEELNNLCRQENIKSGRIEALGAVQKASLGYYNQQTHEFQLYTLDKPLEIIKLIGNISMKDGEPMVHAHLTLSDEEGKAYGGHLTTGTIVFAGEFILEAFEAPILERGFDEITSLPLWNM